MELHPDYPVVSGRVPVGGRWSLDLPQPMNRRVEDGAVVIWRPDLTLWLEVWQMRLGETVAERYASLLAEMPDEAFDLVEFAEPPPRFRYRLQEQGPEGQRPALHGFAVSEAGHLMLAAHAPTPEGLSDARAAFDAVMAH